MKLVILLKICINIFIPKRSFNVYRRLFQFSLLLWLSMTFDSLASGSKNIFEHKESNSYLFSYAGSIANKNQVNNYFIKEIAKFNLAGLYNTSYTFHYEVNNSIQLTSPYSFTVSSEIIGQKCTGDIIYKGFDISEILMPEFVDAEILLFGNGKYIAGKTFYGVTLDNNNHCLLEFVYETLNENLELSIQLQNVRFYSGSHNRLAFNERISHIDNYYAAISVLQQAVQLISSNEFIRTPIPLLYVQLKELNRTYRKVAEGDFLIPLGIVNSDTGGYFNSLAILKFQLTRYSDYFEILFQTDEEIKFEQSIHSYAENYINEVSKYIIQTPHVTHSQVGYYYKLGHIDYNNTILNQYYFDLKKLIGQSKFNTQKDWIIGELQKEIFEIYLDKANIYVDNQQFHIALGLLENAENFYRANFQKALPVKLNILVSKANYGIFNSYLQLIDRAIEVENYNLADNYLDKAMLFQKDNKVSIITDDFITKLTERLTILYIHKGNELLESEEYRNATECFEQAFKLCRRVNRFNYDYEIKHGLMNARNGNYKGLINQIIKELEENHFEVADKLMKEANQLVAGYYYEILYSPEHIYIGSAINYHHYNQLIQEGKTLLDSGNYQLAYRNFLEAFNLEAKSSFDLSDELPELFYRAATPVLVDLCSLGEVKVRKNELEEARNIFTNCLRLQDDYGLVYQEKVQTGITLLNNSIFNKHCDIVNQDFEKRISNFDNFINQNDFISAVAVLNSTDSLCYRNYFCDMDKELITELKAIYGPAAEYQELAKSAQEALSSGDHKKFIEVHERMEFLSDNHEVIRKHIEPLPLHYLFSIKKNLALLETSIEYYKSREAFDVALDLLAVLKANDYTDKDTKALQQKLGSNMALADRDSIYTANPNVIVDEYTEGSTFLKHFKKAYIKTWE